MIIFRAELEVAHDDGDLSTGENQDDEHYSEEPEDVIELVKPD